MVSLSSLFLQETMCSFFLPEAIIRRPVNCTTESHRPQMKCTLMLRRFKLRPPSADEVYTYVEEVQTAPTLHISGLSEKFHLLADFGGAVLAGRELENGRGYQFVTWIWDYNRTGVSYGHYYDEDFCGAKQDFAVRSGLISKTQLFSPEELTELYRATDYLLDEGPELEDGHLKAMQTARTKIEYTVPDLADRLEQGQAQEPQIDM